MKILFVGDSLTASGNWSEVIDFVEVENLAVPGGTTDELMELTERIASSKPDVISLLIGTNDFGNFLLNRSAEDVSARIFTIIERLLKILPNTKIFLHTLLPRGLEESALDLRPRIKELNQLLKADWPNRVLLIDLWPLFVDDDGLSLAEEFVVEGESSLRLHINRNGYYKWEEVLIPELRKLINP
jgi:lysophospholipase L1-like esterase